MEGPSHAERVSRALREEILRGRYRAGDRLPPERELALRHGAHRGAVREGLRDLSRLGLVEIGPRGARVAPIDDASLDVVGHLLELGELPDAELVDQVLELHAGLFSSSARLAVLHGSDAQLERAVAILDRIGAGGGVEALHELADLFVEASGNFVLRLVRNSARTPFWQDLHSMVRLRVPVEPRQQLTRELSRALEARDAAAAVEGVYALVKLHREHVVAALERRHAKAMRAEIESRLIPRLPGRSDADDADGRAKS